MVQPVEGKKLLRCPPLPSYFSSRQFLVPTGDRESQTITRRAELVLFQNWDNGLTFARSREKRESRGQDEECRVRCNGERFGAAHGWRGAFQDQANHGSDTIYHGTPPCRRTVPCCSAAAPGSMKYRTRLVRRRWRLRDRQFGIRQRRDCGC